MNCSVCGTSASRPGHLPNETRCSCGALFRFSPGRCLAGSEIGGETAPPRSR